MHIEGLIKNSGKLKGLKRTGWLESGIKSPESVADHSYRTTLLSMTLSDILELDTLKTVRMALIHDLAESLTGDLTPRQKQGNHAKQDFRALKKALKELPEPVIKIYTGLFKEYQENKTPEARLVHNADKLDMLYQAREYEEKGYRLDQFWETELDPEYEKYRPKRD
jgi:putative hydrolase of HD superfamily